MPTTTFEVGAGTLQPQGRLPTRATRELESSLTSCVMSWRCSSTSAAKTMSQVMEDMMMGAVSPLGWPRIRWHLGVHKDLLVLWITEEPYGSQVCEEEPPKHTSDRGLVPLEVAPRSCPEGVDRNGEEQELLPF